MTRRRVLCSIACCAAGFGFGYALLAFDSNGYVLPHVLEERLNIALAVWVAFAIPVALAIAIPRYWGARPLWRLALSTALATAFLGNAVGVTWLCVRAGSRFERDLERVRTQIEEWSRSGDSQVFLALKRWEREHGNSVILTLERRGERVSARFSISTDSAPYRVYAERWNSVDRKWEIERAPF